MRTNKFLTILRLASLAIAVLPGISHGYGIETHVNINEKIFGFSGLKTYFDNELIMPLTGVNAWRYSDGNMFAIDLFKQGGEDEDYTDFSTWPWVIRPRNHYHVPTKLWNDAGYSYLGQTGLSKRCPTGRHL